MHCALSAKSVGIILVERTRLEDGFCHQNLLPVQNFYWVRPDCPALQLISRNQAPLEEMVASEGEL